MIRTDRGTIRLLDEREGTVRLDNGNIYKIVGGGPPDGAGPPNEPAPKRYVGGDPAENIAVPIAKPDKWPEWLAVGQRVKVTYDDEGGKRQVIDIAKD